jgi:hypothetical protein
MLTVGYELRNFSLTVLTSAVLRFESAALIDDLRRGVLQDNCHTFLQGYDHSLLDIYRPNSSLEILHDRDVALKPRMPLQSIVEVLDENLIVVARSLPPTAGIVSSGSAANPENKILKLRRMLDPRLEIDKRVINLIKKRDRFLRRLDVIENEQDALEMYQDAQRTFGTSTKNNIVASQGDLKINGEFDIPQESSSVFYIAWAAGVPCILKFPESASVAYHESNVYAQITDPRKRHLVHLELIEFSNLPARHANQHCALKMPRYTSTLQSCAQGLELRILFENAAIAVHNGLCAMHIANYCHLDVKPGNIFIDSDGAIFLGDFDAALSQGQAVNRTTPTFLPREMAILHARGLLVASSAVDFGMLVCTLMYMLDVDYCSSPSVLQLQLQIENLDLRGHLRLLRILSECIGKLRLDPQIETGAAILNNSGPNSSLRPNRVEGELSPTYTGLEPLL